MGHPLGVEGIVHQVLGGVSGVIREYNALSVSSQASEAEAAVGEVLRPRHASKERQACPVPHGLLSGLCRVNAWGYQRLPDATAATTGGEATVITVRDVEAAVQRQCGILKILGWFSLLSCSLTAPHLLCIFGCPSHLASQRSPGQRCLSKLLPRLLSLHHRHGATAGHGAAALAQGGSSLRACHDKMEGRLPAEGFEQLRLKSRPELATSALARVGSGVYSTVQQQDYSASVWLSRKERLEHSQQKCIVVFALVCCFAVLVALIFSAVDIWDQDEDGITEDNCNKNCRVVLVETIPEDLPYSSNDTAHVPLSLGLHSLLDLAKKTVEVVSPHWNLNFTNENYSSPLARQGQDLFERLLNLGSQQVSLKVASGLGHSKDLNSLYDSGADVHYLNMASLTKGHLNSSFWVVDKKHMYIGSASMDWRSLTQTKELGVIIYNCSCLALDLHRIFTLYWQLHYKDFVPSMWSKRVFALYNKDHMLKVHLNDTKAEVFISSSPDTFCPKDRTKDIDAIYKVISDARRFIYISITEYLPLVNRSPHRYWSRIDGMLREALILRDIKVRLLISCWTQTNPLTFNFVWSLKTLCTERPNCTLEVKFFSPKEQRNGTAYTINRNKFMVTDNALYIGNFDWVGNEFAYNAGAGLVIRQENRTNHTILDQLKTVFERDWYSRHSKSLQANKIPECIKHRMNQPASPKGSQYSV
ncbi:PLD5 phospholipase, partial [Atractosteus spatula]|nr:PLD5 phospholipase [Atractosteus spatula]